MPVTPPEERFWSKVDVRGPDECWPWTAGCFKSGYGCFHPAVPSVLAHRYVYELCIGPIPAGAHVDHTCHNLAGCTLPAGECPHRRCVNPAHLEPVDRLENLRRGPRHNSRKTHCPYGHEYTPENTYTASKRGERRCRICAHRRDKGRFRKTKREGQE